MNVIDLVATLSLDSSKYDSGLEESGSKAEGFGGKMKNALGTAGKVAAGAMAAATGAAVGAGVAFIKGAGSVAEYGDNIDKMSQKMGISATAYQEWDAIMQHCGTSIDAMKPSMKTLAQQAEKGSDAFQKLGISQEEVATLSQEDLFSRVISGLQGMEEGTERTAITAQLLGRGATELGALLNTSAEDTEKMRQKVHELGGVMSDEAVKDAAAYRDSLQDLQTSMAGVKRGLMSEMLPSITTVMDGLTKIFSGKGDEGVKQITEGVSQLADNIMKAMPKLLEVAGQIIMAIATAIANNLPKIIEVGVQIIVSIVTGIVEYLPEIIPVLIPALVKGLVEIVKALIINLPAILKALWDAISSLVIEGWNALKQRFPVLEKVEEVFKTIFNVIKTVVSAIIGFFKGAVEIIKTVWSAITGFFKGLWEGIKTVFGAVVGFFQGIFQGAWDAIQTVWNAVVGFFQGIWDGIKEVFGTIGSWFQEKFQNAKELAQAAWEGVKGFFSRVWDNIKSVFKNVGGWFKEKFTKAKENAQNAWSGVKGRFSKAWSNIKSAFSNTGSWFREKFSKAKDNAGNAFSGVKSRFSKSWDNIKSVFRSVSSWFSEKFTAAKNAIGRVWSKIKEVLTAPFEKAKEVIQGIANKIKSMFGFTVSPKVNVPKAPGVTKHAKAMHQPYMFSKQTFFAAGEVGDEVLYGRSALMRDIAAATQGGGKTINMTFNVSGAENPQEFAGQVARELEIALRTA